jgi:hypothetical protein
MKLFVVAIMGDDISADVLGLLQREMQQLIE